jgi:hypothetical protein
MRWFGRELRELREINHAKSSVDHRELFAYGDDADSVLSDIVGKRGRGALHLVDSFGGSALGVDPEQFRPDQRYADRDRIVYL